MEVRGPEMTERHPMGSGFRSQRDLLNTRLRNIRVRRLDGVDHVALSEWRLSSATPSIILDIDGKRLGRSVWVLTFDATPTRPDAAGTLDIDYGNGFSECDGIAVAYGDDRRSHVILTDVDRIHGLRWRPDDRAGAGIRIDHLRIVDADAATEDFVQDFRASNERDRPWLSRIRAKLNLSASDRPGSDAKDLAFLKDVNVAFRRLGGSHRPVTASSPPERVDANIAETLFVIPSIDGAHLLERMLPSLDIPRSCLVVLDQGSTDRTEAFCRRSGIELIQLGAPKTRAQAYNIGLDLAERRGCRYFYTSSNTVRFVTSVAHELLSEIAADERLAIVAPSQIRVDARSDLRPLAHRAQWDLSGLDFTHDVQGLTGEIERIEADFCTLTCALLRVSAATAVGGFDEAFGYCLEDADLCFRLRGAGYACATLPRSQIEHDAASAPEDAFGEGDHTTVLDGKRHFARKHLGFGIDYSDRKPDVPKSWTVVDKHLHLYLHRNGLIDASRPELVLAHPGTKPFGYLYRGSETDQRPEAWHAHAASYRAVFDCSTWGCAVSGRAGCENVHYVPPGVETDTFHPWGASERLYDEKTYLWIGRRQHRDDLEVMLKAWHRFRASAPNARLIVMGHGVLAGRRHDATEVRRWRGSLVLDLPHEGIQFRETIDVMSDDERAIVYRSVDFLVSTGHGEGFQDVVVQAMACGLTPIFPGYAAGSDLLYEGALAIEGVLVRTDAGDTDLGDVGHRWEPTVESVVAQLNASLALSDHDRGRLDRVALRMVRSRFTWRNTCTAIRSALQATQLQADVGHRPVVEQARPPSMLNLAIALETGDPRAEGTTHAATDGCKPYFDAFNPEQYLRYNPDVLAAGMDPFVHFTRHGWHENRRISPHYTVAQLLAVNRLVRRRLLQDAGIDLTPGALPASGTGHDDVPSATVRPVHGADHIAAHADRKHGVLFIGYVEAGLGLGESLRSLVRSVAASDINPRVYPFNVSVEDRFIGHFSKETYDQDHAYAINVFEMAADQLPAALGELGAWRTDGSYNIFRTYWELPKADESWRSTLSGIDELWAPTRFVAKSFRSIYDGKITIVPTIVDIDESVSPDRRLFGLDEDRFYFVFSFDYHSSPARKNPLAVLQAFRTAFPENEKVGLVIKSIGPKDANARVRAEIDRVVRSDPRVVLVDRSLSREHMTVLLKSCDCYVSLHRSEGFGLGMAEAMMLSKPVIGTGYGGCTDFLTSETGFPVAYTLRRILHGEYPFSDNLAWAEPDIGDAAEHMKAVFADRSLAAAKASAGYRLITEHFSSETVGAIAIDRIKEIFATLTPRRDEAGREADAGSSAVGRNRRDDVRTPS